MVIIMKKILSIFLSALLVLSVFCGVISVNAEETTSYSVGERPYAVEGFTNEPVVTSGSGVTFYDDFIPRDVFDDCSADDTADNYFAKKIKLNYANFSATSDTATATLETGAENVYGGTGSSYKLTYKKSAPVPIKAQGKEGNSYYQRIISSKNFYLSKAAVPNLTIGFWVKTDKPVYVVVRCLDYSSSSASQYLISKEIIIPAGESIIEVPVSSMSVLNDGYVKGNNKNDDTKINVYYPEILFRAVNSFAADETERNIYFDNIGFYAMATNGAKKAYHKTGSITKLGINDYFQVEGNSQQVGRTSGTLTYKWLSSDGATGMTISPCGSDATSANANAYNGKGQSICYYSEKTNGYTSTAYNHIRTNEEGIRTSDNYATFWGEKATIAVWVKASRALRVQVMAQDTTNKVSGVYKTSKEYFVPAGESILRIPVADLDTFSSGTENADRAWKSLLGFRLSFRCAGENTSSIGGSATTLYIDDIRVECPKIGDTNDDAAVNVLDLVRLKKHIAKVAYNDMDSVYFDVGGEEVDEKGYSVADGNINSTDLSVMRKYLIGSGKLAIAPYVAAEAEATAIVASVSQNWGYDEA